MAKNIKTLNDYKNVIGRQEIPKSVNGRATITQTEETEYARVDEVKPLLDKAKLAIEQKEDANKQLQIKLMVLEDTLKKVANQRDHFKEKFEVVEEENQSLKSKFKGGSLINHDINQTINKREEKISRECKEYKDLSSEYEKMYLI